MTDPSLPEAIGPYTILETIATFAFTVTYRAEQRHLGRTVLVKTLKSTVSVDSPFAAELEREAAVLGRLDHEAVLKPYDFTRTEGALWLVLEDARGASLEAVLAAARLELDQALAIALAVARGLGHAHERGVVHRALRTAVVAIAPGGRVVITDFSAADAAAAHLPSLPEPLEAGETFARPDFMAPEQILGEAAGPRSDVWALGVLLHELITGARPFDAEDPRVIAQRIRFGPPAPLPAGVPRAIERVLARCLAKDPGDRYEDARAAAAAIEDALAAVSRLPVRLLASRALAAARLGEALAPPSGAAPEARPAPDASPSAARAARPLAAVLALIVAGGAAIQLLGDPDAGTEGAVVTESGPPPAGSRDRGLLRVVATPWAEVFVDGELIDVTPIGRGIPVTPGKHFVTFRHPSAADEQRSIKIAAGQTVFLDVTMRLDRGDAGRPEAGIDAGSP